MKVVFSESWEIYRSEIMDAVSDFSGQGRLLGEGKRNVIKIFQIAGKEVNIKSFKLPNLVNRIVYRYFRKSKAERSFLYAKILLSKGIGTPEPIAFVEKNSMFYFRDSYYITRQQDCDLVLRQVIDHYTESDHPEILKAFARFTFDLHEKQVEFLDHSPGNTLITRGKGGFEFSLVDLNRMAFKPLDFEERMKNFARLTTKQEVLRILAAEYAHLSGRKEEEVFQKMWIYTRRFQKKFHGKKALKSQVKFWKKSR